MLHSTFVLYPGEGFSRELDILNLAEEVGVVQRKGSWFAYNDKSIAQGIDAMRTKLQDDDELLNQIWADTLNMINAPIDKTTGEVLNDAA